MSRRFAIIGHRAPSSGKINLNDLAGSSGRIDVLARAVNTALFLSHGIREDTDIILHLKGGPGPNRRILFEGSKLRGAPPDERAIAGLIGKALKEPVAAIGQFVELQSGLWHSGGGIQQTPPLGKHCVLAKRAINEDGEIRSAGHAFLVLRGRVDGVGGLPVGLGRTGADLKTVPRTF